MKLIPASGSPRMQKALSNVYVRTIVRILLDYWELLPDVADVLQSYEQHTQFGFIEDLEKLRINRSRSNGTDTDGNTKPPVFIKELIQTLHNLYKQPKEDVRYQRGAIVELLTYELVRPRYKAGECLSNQRFLDERGRAITDQVDVAALSQEKSQLEGYECKLKVDGIESSDCTNLAYLATAAQERDYEAHVGIVSFDGDKYMQRKLARLQPDRRIHLYGLDSMALLEQFPF